MRQVFRDDSAILPRKLLTKPKPTFEEQWQAYFLLLLKNPIEARQVVRRWRDQANALELMLNQSTAAAVSVSYADPDLIGHA